MKIKIRKIKEAILLSCLTFFAIYMAVPFFYDLNLENKAFLIPFKSSEKIDSIKKDKFIKFNGSIVIYKNLERDIVSSKNINNIKELNSLGQKVYIYLDTNKGNYSYRILNREINKIYNNLNVTGIYLDNVSSNLNFLSYYNKIIKNIRDHNLKVIVNSDEKGLNSFSNLDIDIFIPFESDCDVLSRTSNFINTNNHSLGLIVTEVENNYNLGLTVHKLNNMDSEYISITTKKSFWDSSINDLYKLIK